jgi:hypothetical protein
MPIILAVGTPPSMLIINTPVDKAVTLAKKTPACMAIILAIEAPLLPTILGTQ